MAVDVEGPSRRFDQLDSEHVRVTGCGADIHHDRKLVTAHSRRGAAAAKRRLESMRNLLEQLVAGGVTERIVDGLEAVEVDDQEREAAEAGRFLDAGRQPVLQHVPVGEARQRVMIGPIAKLVLQPREIGDVLVRRHPSAIAERLVDDGDDASRIEVEHRRRIFVPPREFDAPGDIVLRIVADMAAGRDAAPQDLLERGAAPAKALGQVVDVEELLVAVDELVVPVEDRDGEPSTVDGPLDADPVEPGIAPGRLQRRHDLPAERLEVECAVRSCGLAHHVGERLVHAQPRSPLANRWKPQRFTLGAHGKFDLSPAAGKASPHSDPAWISGFPAHPAAWCRIPQAPDPQ